MTQQLVEYLTQEEKWAAERAQHEADRVDRAQISEEERATERAQRKEARGNRARVREDERSQRLDELKTNLTTGRPLIENPPASTPNICIETSSKTTSDTPNNKFKEESTATNSITITSNSNKHHTINLCVAHQNTVLYGKWSK